MLQTIVTQGWRRLAQAALGLGMAALLSACGGGGGSAGDPVVGGGTSSGGTTTDTAKVSVALSSTTVTAGAPATVSVTVVNKSGAVLPGLVVKFATASGLGSLSATSALTDASGKASVVLSPATAATTGADTLTATVTYLGTDYSASTGFQLNATNVTISSFTSDVNTLSAYGTSTLTVTLGGTSATSSVSLTMTSSCVTVGKATLTPASVTTTTGKATFTLRDQGCGAVQSSDNLTLAVTGTTLTQSLSLPVSSPAAASIGFVSASPTNIYLKGSGLTESSLVTFQVKDASNNGLPGQTVVLTPNVLVGGLTLDDQTGSVTKTTDSSGNVIVRINSGTVPTPVRVKATLQGSTSISTVSSALSIGVGLPSQLNFSLAQGTQNIEGYDIQGTTNTYTIIASDRLGNPVPDGTAINFVTTAGQINASKQTAVNGNGIATATANFVSASPVPADGHVTVVAYALGEKSFLDVNGNNVYDAGEDFQDLGDIFIDRKFDNYYNAADDQYISLSTGVGSLACVAATSPLLATDVSIPVRPNTCNQTWGQAYVRRAVQTIFSRSTANPVWGTARNVNEGPPSATNLTCSTAVSLIKNYTNNVANTASYYQVAGSSLYFGSNVSGSFSMFVADSNSTAFNPMPAGTTISVTATDGITASVLGGTPVPSTPSPTGLSIGYKFGTASSGTITINITSPGGTVTAVPVNVATGAAPAACSN